MNTRTARTSCTFRRTLPESNRKKTPMKKAILMLCALCLLLAGCSEQTPQVSMLDIYNANRTEVILSQWGSFGQHIEMDDGTCTNFYADEEIYYTEYNSESRQLVGDDFLFVYDGGEYYGYLLADGGAYRATFDSMTLSEDTIEELIVGIEAEGDRLVVTTRIEGEAARNQVERDFGTTYMEGDWIEVEYEVDRADLRLLRCSAKLLHADGTQAADSMVTLIYGIERPKLAQEMLKRCFPENDLRTLTVVLDPNTDKEQVYFRTVRKGDAFAIILPEGYQLYLDEACTILQTEPGDSNAHLLLFAKKAS